jgi:hypothetical protein
MAREDWSDRNERDRDDERERRRADDFGQADYSTRYGYDPERRTGYRTDSRSVPDDYDRAGPDRLGPGEREYVRRLDAGDYRRDDLPRDEPQRNEGRSWADRAGAFFSGSGAAREEAPRRRRGPSDRVLWAVISERLEDERRLDLSDVEVLVENAEVTLNGTVRRKEDKRRIEDIADIDGVDHVQNNLRVRQANRSWGFL